MKTKASLLLVVIEVSRKGKEKITKVAPSMPSLLRII